MATGNKVVKAGLWYTAVSFLTKGAVFLTTPLFTRMMTKVDIGAFSNMASWLEIMIPLVTFDFVVSLGIARFDYKEELDQYISSILVYGSIGTTLFYILFLTNMDTLCSLFSLRPYMVHIIFLYLLVYPALQAFQSENMFRYKYKMSALISLSSILLSVGTALFLTKNGKDQLFGRAIGYYGTLILYNLAIYVYLLCRGRAFSWKYFKYAFAVAFPMIWHTLSLKLLTAGDRIVITQTIGEEANALYTIAYTCSHIVAVLYSSMNNAWSPWSTERMNAGETAIMKKASRYYILLYSIIVFFTMLICPELLLVMGGRGYMTAKYVLPPVMVSCICQFVYSLYINAEFYLKKQARIAVGTIVAALINIGLNYIFVPRYGYVAAAYTTLIGYLCLFIFHFVSLLLLGKKDWYDNTFNWAIVIAFLGIMFAVNWIYKNDAVRILLFIVCLLVGIVVCLHNRKLLMKYFKLFFGLNKKRRINNG